MSSLNADVSSYAERPQSGSVEAFRRGAGNLAALYPRLAAEWDRGKNGGLTPEMVTPGSHRKVWWKCGKGHSWAADIGNRVAGTGCPYCSNKLVLTGYNDLATTHPRLAAEWDAEKNAIRPTEVTAGSHKKVWWKCAKGHSWSAHVSNRASAGYNCPVCSGRAVAAGENDLASMCPDIAAEWDAEKNGNITPENVVATSHRKFWWRCPLGHSYEASASNRTFHNKSCPYCANQRVLEGYNDLATQDPAVAEQWHPDLNGAVTPAMVTRGSRRKVWWICPYGHVWKAVVYSRTGNKTGCPVCAGNARGSPAAEDAVKYTNSKYQEAKK